MYPALFFGDVLLIVGTFASLAVATFLVGRAARRRPAAGTVAMLLVLACVPAVVLRVAIQLGLASYGPEFARDHLAIGLPLALVPLVALAAVPRRGRTSTAGTVAVRTAAVAPLLSWHFVFVPPGSVALAAVAYAAVLAAVAAAATLAGTRPAARAPARLLRLGAGGVVAVVGIVAVVGWSGRVAPPGADYAALAGTPVDAGGGPVAGHDAHLPLGPGVRSIADLRGPAGTPDARFTLTAQVAGDRWTYDGTVPGPELRVTEGRLVEVTLVNRDVPAGVTLHWHGLHVRNAEDGVAGVTQDAVRPGGRHVYRFRPDQAGTFWYHSHQQSSEGVSRGLAGALVVLPRTRTAAQDVVVVDHPEAAPPPVRRVAAGTPVRLRIVNAGNGAQRYRLAGTPFRVVAVDGADLSGPAEVRDTGVRVAAGGRYDLAFAMPSGAVALTGGVHDVVLSPDGTRGGVPSPQGGGVLDPLAYGTPLQGDLGPDTRWDRDFDMVIDQRLGTGGTGFDWHWTVDGRVWPDLPTYTVREGDAVRIRIVNRSTADHPIHLHGHHFLVLSRGDVRASGSPWRTDTLDVRPGETYEVAFRADNPGIWMDHCHDLSHARAGFVMHLAYEGYGTPFRLGEATGNVSE